MTLLFGTIAALAGVVAVSYLVEAFRRAPRAPDGLTWAPDIPIRHLSVSGIRLRYIEVGSGPPLVLLHTMRTQLDLFQRVIPPLWEEERARYGDIRVPVLLLHGEHDWSRPEERTEGPPDPECGDPHGRVGRPLSLVRRAGGRDLEGDGVRGSAPRLRRTHS